MVAQRNLVVYTYKIYMYSSLARTKSALLNAHGLHRCRAGPATGEVIAKIPR